MKELEDFTAHIESLFNFKGDVTRADADTLDIALGVVVSNQNRITLANLEASVKALLVAVGNSFDRVFEGLRGQCEMQWRERPDITIAFDSYDYEIRKPICEEERAIKMALWMRLRIPNLPDSSKAMLLIVPEGCKFTYLNQ